MSRWDAVGCDEDAEQIRGSPPFHETGSGCLPNFSHLGNVPQFLVGLGKCAVSFVNHYQVWPVIFHILQWCDSHWEEQTNPSSFRMPYRTTVSSICSTSHDGGWQSTHFAFAVLANAHEWPTRANGVCLYLLAFVPSCFYSTSTYQTRIAWCSVGKGRECWNKTSLDIVISVILWIHWNIPRHIQETVS